MALSVLLGSPVAAGSGCAAAPPTTEPAAATPPAAQAEPAPAEAAPAPTDPNKLDAETARTETRRIMAEVARARNLAVKGDMGIELISREGVRDFAKEAMYEHMTREELQLFGRIEKSLGVLPMGADPERVLLDLLEEGVLGLYDPKRKTLFIGDHVGNTMLSMVAGHEIAHGLQDMHFDLDRLQLPIDHQSDAETARTFLVEGDAQASYWAWVSGEGGLQAISEDVLMALGNQALDLADAMPYPILVRQLQLPYADGAATVARLAKQKGWEAVDALYGALPPTSEQMLHVDKLLAAEKPIAVQLRGEPLLAALPGHAQVWHDTLGEADLLAMLAETSASPAARKAAAGWGGSHLLVFDHGQNPAPAPVVVGALAWDTQTDAKEFEAAFADYLETQVGDASAMARKGSVVYFATGIPTGVDPDALLAAAKKAARVGRGASR